MENTDSASIKSDEVSGQQLMKENCMAPVVEYRIPVKIGGRPPHPSDNTFDDSQRYRPNHGKLNMFGDRPHRDSPLQRFRGYHGGGRWNKSTRQRDYYSDFSSPNSFHPYAMQRSRNTYSSRPNYHPFRTGFRISGPRTDYEGARSRNSICSAAKVYGSQSQSRPFSPIRHFRYGVESDTQHYSFSAMHASRMRFATFNNNQQENDDQAYQSTADCGNFTSEDTYAIYSTDNVVSDVCTCDSECNCEHYSPENYQLDASVSKSGTERNEIENLNKDTIGHSPEGRARSRSRNSSSSSDGSLSVISSDSSVLTNEDSGLSSMGSSSTGEKLSLPVSPNASEISEDGTLKTDTDAFAVVYLEAKAARVFDETGKTEPRTASCYAIWFGDGDCRNVFREVPSFYNQERGKSAYILAVSQAISIIKGEGATNQVHILMGSEFVMSNMKSWILHMKDNIEPTDWTEHKHHYEITQLLDSMDGMLMKFSVAALTDVNYLKCRKLLLDGWEKMVRSFSALKE